MAYRAGEYEQHEVTLATIGTWYVRESIEQMGEVQHDLAVEVDTEGGPVRCWIPAATLYGQAPAEEMYAAAIEKARRLSSTGEVRSVARGD